MLEIQEIAPDDPELDAYARNKSTLAFSKQSSSTVVADGEKTVLRLLTSSWSCRSLLILEKYYNKHTQLFQSKVPGNKIFVADKQQMQRIAGYAVHQGCMGIFSAPDFRPARELSAPLVALNRVRDAENVGSIVRNCLAFGVQDLLFDAGSCSPYVRRAIRVAMGHTPRMRIARTTDLKGALRSLSSRGIAVIGTSRQARQSLYAFQFPQEFALVLGNEGQGLDEEAKSACDYLLQIPMQNNIDSLNVGNALSAILAIAQRTEE